METMENRSAHIYIFLILMYNLVLLKRKFKVVPLIYESQLIYEKLPRDISERHVLLLDPVLATGAWSLLRCIFGFSPFWWIFNFSKPYLHDCCFLLKVTLLIKPLNYSFRKEFLNLTLYSSTLSRWVLKSKLSLSLCLFASLSLSRSASYYNIALL